MNRENELIQISESDIKNEIISISKKSGFIEGIENFVVRIDGNFLYTYMVSDHILYYEFTQNEKGENVLIFKRCADGEENGKWIGWYTKGYDNPEDEIDYPHTRMVFKYTKFEIIEQRDHEWNGKNYLFVKYRLTNEQNNLSFEFDHDFVRI